MKKCLSARANVCLHGHLVSYQPSTFLWNTTDFDIFFVKFINYECLSFDYKNEFGCNVLYQDSLLPERKHSLGSSRLTSSMNVWEEGMFVQTWWISQDFRDVLKSIPLLNCVWDTSYFINLAFHCVAPLQKSQINLTSFWADILKRMFN